MLLWRDWIYIHIYIYVFRSFSRWLCQDDIWNLRIRGGAEAPIALLILAKAVFSGNGQVKEWKDSPSLMGKSTISMAIFNSKL